MRIVGPQIAEKVRSFCSKIGQDRLIVQGAGGNISWKDKNCLWIKASGKWLAKAENENIFLPVDFQPLLNHISKGNFLAKPRVLVKTDLKPSIETLMHAILPHTIVLHVHAIEILAHLVRVDAKRKLEKILGDTFNWIFIDYYKPGAELANVLAQKILEKPDVNMIFLGSHGIVLGGESVEEIRQLLYKIILKLKILPKKIIRSSSKVHRSGDFLKHGYVLCKEEEINLLATNKNLIKKIRKEWPLYPDHVVFLGAEPIVLERNFSESSLQRATKNKPPFIFSVDDGVYQPLNAKVHHKVQLLCYYDVIIRQEVTTKLSKLNQKEVFDLLNWDAETHRQNLQ